MSDSVTLSPVTHKRHHRGRKAPDNIAAMRHLAHERNGHFVKAVPNITAVTWDSRTLGLIGPVKDQAQCGSCWCFSGTGVVETAFYKAGILKPDGSQALSEEYTLDCGQNGGCDGDDNTTVLAWAKATGLPFTSDYGPYTAGNGNTGSCKYKAGTTLNKITDWGFAGTQQGVTAIQDIKNAIAAYGCVGCAVAAGDDWDNAGPTTTINGTSTGIDHDVILVGWDDNHDNGDGSKGAWIMRNSWGTSWAQNGYCWIKYGADSIGTESVWAIVAGGPTPVPPSPIPPGPTPPGPVGPTLAVPALPVAFGGFHIPGLATAPTTIPMPMNHLQVGAVTIPWATIITIVQQLFAQYGPAIVPYIDQWLATLNLPAWALATIKLLLSSLLGVPITQHKLTSKPCNGCK